MTAPQTDQSRPAAGLEAFAAPCHIGAVALRVVDLAAMTAFYRDRIGLALIARTPERATLGVAGWPLLHLLEGAVRPTSPVGLFHLALVLPSRAALADWFAHAAGTGLALEGASDHLVSEALYLSDPEGNGIEIYRDRPRADWPRRDGRIAMATERLDLAALLREAAGGAYSGLPDGTRMGHVHLRVGDTLAAEAFYRDALGFDLTVRYPGASFFASGGYHHHIAVNVWSSRGAGARGPGEAGLDHVEIVAARDPDFAALRARMLAAGGADDGEAVTVADPWGARLRLRR